MIPILNWPRDARRVESLLAGLRLDPVQTALGGGQRARMIGAVTRILADVARRGDAAVVRQARLFDDPKFTAPQLRVPTSEMRRSMQRVPPVQLAALRKAIAQVRQYQSHFLPKDPKPLRRDGVELSMRFTPLDSVGLCVPGGKAAYPSSVVMLAVPAQVAGVQRIVVCTPASPYGRSDLVMAACYELGLTDVFRAGGPAAIGAMAFGTQTIPKVDKIVGPGNAYVQLAKRAVAGAVGVDGFLGPSEILTLADDSARPAFIAADMLAQAEHDPGSSFLLTTSAALAKEVCRQIDEQINTLSRRAVIEKALSQSSAIIVAPSMNALLELANRFAAEHVNLQLRHPAAALARLHHAGAIFVGPYSPVAAGDYLAGPSHCLPTNTTARFSSGISVLEFLKHSSVVTYSQSALRKDAAAIQTIAAAEHLDAHAASVRIRV